MARNAQKRFPTLVADNEDLANPDGIGRSGVGDMLRAKRLERDEDLKDVAQALRIRLPYLQAIEDGAPNALPGATYAVGFVRAYATYLGMEVEATVDRFKAETAALEARTELVFPEPLPGNRVPGGALIILALLLAGMSYGGWLYLSNQDRSVAELVPALPDSLAKILDGAETPAGDDQGAENGVSVPSTSSDDGAPAPSAPSTEGASGTVEETASDSPAPVDPEATESVASGDASDPFPETSDTQPPTNPTPTEESVTATPPRESEPVAQEEITTQSVESEPDVATSESSDATSLDSTVPADSQGEEEAALNTTTQQSQPETVSVSDPSNDAASVSDGIAGALSETVEEEILPPPPEPVVANETTPASAPRGDVPDTTETAASDASPTSADTVAAVPEETNAPRDQAATPAEEPAATVATNDTTAPAPGEDAADTDGIAAPSAPAGSDTVSAATPPEATVVLSAKSDSWIEIRDASGETLYTGMLRPGQTYKLPPRRGATLTTGNAGGLTVTVDGVETPSLGEPGAVRRDISLNPDDLL